MSRQSEYTIDLIVKEDEARETLNQITHGLDEVAQHAKEASKGINIGDALEQASVSAVKMGERLNEIALASNGDETFFDAYEKGASKAESALVSQYAQLQAANSEEGKALRLRREELKTQLEQTTNKKEQKKLQSEINAINKKVIDLSDEEIAAAIQKNREARLALKTAVSTAKFKVAEQRAAKAQAKEATAAQKQEFGRFKILRQRLQALLGERKQLEAIGKSQEKILKTVEATEKQQKAVTQAIKDSERAQSRMGKWGERIRSSIQTAYNVTGMVGGVGRTIKAGGQAIAGVTRDAMTAADDEARKEKEARRIKGYYGDEAMGILNELYFQTGGDYAVIVDAINRVQTTLKTANKDDLIQATRLELRNPGMSLAFASSNTSSSVQNYRAYAHRMESIQRATGASEEQIQASAQKMANYKAGAFGNTSVTELQAVYLGLQNSGAFESQEELDKAFDRFVNSRRNSKESAWKDAQAYDWASHVHNVRNRLQATNALKNMDWKEIRLATNALDVTPVRQTSLESTSEQMRRIEYQKNQILVKLLPALTPLFDGLAKLLASDAGKKTIQGLLKFIQFVVPKLADIFISLAEKLGLLIDIGDSIVKQNEEQTQRQIDAAKSGSTAAIIASRSGSDHVMGLSNGGIASFPSICGERGPEAIIPLDYSRAQRAENIANTVNQTFNMGNSQTTALSLAQAVRSRDFTRAMTDNQFFTRRCGAF